MSADIAVLETDRAACVADAVATLEEALRQAREGEVIAVAVVVVRPNLATSSTHSRTDNLPTLIGGTALLSARLIASAD